MPTTSCIFCKIVSGEEPSVQLYADHDTIAELELRNVCRLRDRRSNALDTFHRRWTEDFEALRERRRRELTAFEEAQRAELEAFNEEIKAISRAVKPPGAPRKRASIFG